MLLILGAIFILGLIFANETVMPAKNFPVGEPVKIEEGMGVREIASELRVKGYIKSRSLFKFIVIVAGKARDLKAGEYYFDEPLSMIDIARRIANGIHGVPSVKITIPEGFNLAGIAQLFEEHGMFSAEDFYAVAGKPGANNSALADFSSASDILREKPSGASLEGYLFPDTFFYKNDSPESAVRKMLENFNKKISEDLRREVRESGKNFYEILTLASLLEEEAFEDEDRRIIAGILWKRIEAGMPLQVDATLTYLTGKGSDRLTLDDLQMDSLYNTYRYKGLPKGPISNPGLEAIKAALNPEDSPFVFYLSDKSGKIHYAKTFEEHKLNKAKYIR